MEIASKRAEKIIAKLSDLVAQTEEMKLDHGASSRSVRQWKKDIKSRYSALLDETGKLVNASRNKQEELNKEIEQRKEELKQEQQIEEERGLESGHKEIRDC